MIARIGGWKNGSTASVIYRNAYRKLMAAYGDSDNGSAGHTVDSTSGTKNGSPTRGKKRPADSSNEGASGSRNDAAETETPTTPTKPKRQRKTKAPAVKEETIKEDSTTNDADRYGSTL